MNPNDEWRTATTPSGLITAFLNGIALHSRFDPAREAKRVAASIPEDTAIVVLGGFGLGYVAEALLEAAPNRPLIIAEADRSIIERAASVRNIGPLTGNPLVKFVSGEDVENIGDYLSGGPVGSRIFLVVWRPSERGNPPWYSALRQAVMSIQKRREINARTLERFGHLWIRNLIANVPILPRTLKLSSWEGKFKNIPALIVAGGPSVEIVLPELDNISRSHLIIVVDTAVSAVTGAGVKPDIIAAVDPQYWNTRHLDWCAEEAGDCPILAEAATHPAVFRTLSGPPLLTKTKFPLGTLLEDAAGIQGELKSGGSVATTAWELARFLGCKPLSVAGLDLGFPGGRTHFSGSFLNKMPHFYSRRTLPAEQFFFSSLYDASPYYSKSYKNEGLLTNLRMDIYADWFAESIATSARDRTPRIVGDSGRRIKGMATVDVSRIKELPDVRGKIDSILAVLLDTSTSSECASNIRGVIEDVSEKLYELILLANKGMELAIEAGEAIANSQDPRAQLAAMEDVDKRLLAMRSREIVSFLMQPIIVELSSSRSNSEPLENSRRLYSEIAKSANYHRCRLDSTSRYTATKNKAERPIVR